MTDQRMMVVAEREAPWRDALSLRPAPAPASPGEGELQVEVIAAGLAFPDVLQIEGKHFLKRQTPFVPCSEVSGRVTAVGDGVTGFRVGDRICGSTSSGALCPVTIMAAQNAYHIPDGVSGAVAAGFELNYGTAYHALHDLGRAQRGERLLVLGASGGIGMAAVDLGQALGLEVVACASSETKLAACKKAGATTLVDYSTSDFKSALSNAGVYGKIDVVVDPVGGPWSEVALRAMRWGGRFLVIGFAAGGITPDSAIPRLPLNHILLNERQVIGCFWGPWKAKDRNITNRANITKLLNMIPTGQLRPYVSRSYGLHEYSDAIQAMMGRTVLGKVVIVLGEEKADSPASRL